MRLSEVMKQIQEMLGPALRAAKAVTQARLGMILLMAEILPHPR